MKKLSTQFVIVPLNLVATASDSFGVLQFSEYRIKWGLVSRLFYNRLLESLILLANLYARDAVNKGMNLQNGKCCAYLCQ